MDKQEYLLDHHQSYKIKSWITTRIRVESNHGSPQELGLNELNAQDKRTPHQI